jgi:hypothetical protein
MALARCEERCGKPEGCGKNVYVATRQPISHPNSGVVCGTGDCENAAVVWLVAEEEAGYKNGQRVFRLHKRWREAASSVMRRPLRGGSGVGEDGAHRRALRPRRARSSQNPFVSA